jgi:hypothetical protein
METPLSETRQAVEILMALEWVEKVEGDYVTAPRALYLAATQS